MAGDRLRIRGISRTWTAAVVGGFVAIPLTVGHYWLSGGGNEFSINMVLVGGFVAGYLARSGAAHVGSASVGAGAIGGLAGFVWILPAVLDTATDFAVAWSFPPAMAAFVLLFSAALLVASALTGLLGGMVGSWLATVVERKRTAVAGT